MSTHSSPFPSCFRPPPSSAGDDVDATPLPLPPPPPLPPHVHDNTNLTTCLYHSPLGIFSLTWSRTLFGRSLHLHLFPHCPFPSSFHCSPSSSTLSFHLHMNNIFFWKKRGSQRCGVLPSSTVLLFWDLSRAKFGSGPEPLSAFYIAVVVDGELGLLVGDLGKLARARTRARMSNKHASQGMFLRREHVFGNRVYNTTAMIGAKNREISVDCNVNGDGKLSFCVDKKRVLQVKRLKWKFRGNERVEFEGESFQVSWDVYNWLFEDISSNGHAVFMFRFDDKRSNMEGDYQQWRKKDGDKDKEDCVSKQQQQQQPWSSCSFGMNEIEVRKMRKSMRRAARSGSSSSMSSSASSCGSNSSVMEWASTEENELTGPVGFSLLVYAWKRP